MAKTRALITGITGQDGTYLANFLLDKNYEVYGMYRRGSLDVLERIGELKDRIHLVEGDLIDSTSLTRIIRDTQPTEVYNLASQSFVPASWTQPIATAEMTGLGAAKLLETIRLIKPDTKYYQASSSEMFGKVQEVPQTEETPFYPRSPYGVAKVFAYWTTVNYRESYGLYACNGILFNHESPKRGKQFVTRKITHSVAKIKLGYQESFSLGNINAKRDWGYAGDYVEAMWMMLQQKKPKDYVISTGETHSVGEFVEESFKAVDMPINWKGKGMNKTGNYDGKTVISINPKFFRPAEVDLLIGNPEKARSELGWNPKVKFKGLVKMMVESDLELLRKYGLREGDK
jgi:GDPmannose 4,6-dehydratase